MTAEALAHGRERRTLGVHHARVTRRALPANFRQCQVLVVVDRNLAARAYWRHREHGLHLMGVAMAARAERRAWHALPGIMRGDVVTAHAAQARRLAGRAASNAGQ